MSIFSYIRERAARGLTVVLALLLVVPVSPHEAASVLLCIEPGGTVNVERSVENDCTSLSASHADKGARPAGASFAAPVEHCTNCTDVALTLGGASDPCFTAVSAPATVDLSTLRSMVVPDDLGSTFLHVAANAPSLILGPKHSTETAQGSPVSSLLSTCSVVLLI